MRSRFGFVKPLLAGCMLVALFLPFFGCGPKEPENRVGKVKEGGLELSLEIPKGDFKAGKKIPMTISVKNVGGSLEILDYNTSQRFDVEVKDAQDRPVWRWSAGQIFTQALEQVKLKPDEFEDDTAIWEQKDAAGQQIAPGEYTMTARSAADEVTKPVSLKIKIVK